MPTALALTGLLMGLAGGPHCIAMCGAACAGIGRAAGGRALWLFQGGRFAGYSALGALAAASVQGIGWLALQTAALRPLWTLANVAALALGLVLLVRARQPEWLERAARAVWERARRVNFPAAPFVVGMAWAFMPCGLLYAALTVAALAGGPGDGAVVMASFALGSAVSLAAGPALWLRLRLHPTSGDWGIRLAGGALAATAGWGVWLGVAHQSALLCTVH
jgi:sulfite exporter TauE/SafE